MSILLQGTPEWVDARRDHIGSSDIPILTGNSPYRTSPFALWAYKTRRVEAPEVDPMTQELWDLGHALEPVIAARYTALTGRPVRRLRRMLVSKAIPWAAASLDRVSAVKGDRRIIEIKWVPWRRWVEGPEPVPAYVQDQVQWQLMVSGYEMAEVAVLNGSHIEHHEIGPDPAYQDALLAIGGYFWTYNLVGGVPPGVDGSEATRQALLRLYPRDDGSLMEPTAELEALMVELRGAIPDARSAKEREDRLRNAIRGALGEHAGAEGQGWRVTHRLANGTSRVDWQAVARVAWTLTGLPSEKLDEEVERHTTTSEGSRRLVPTWKKEEGSWT